MRKTGASKGPNVALKDTASRIRAKISHVRLLSGASVPLWLFMLHQAKDGDDAADPTPYDKDERERSIGASDASARSCSALSHLSWRFRALLSPRPGREALLTKKLPQSRSRPCDCAQDDSRSPASDGHAHKCSLAGLCCLASCEAQTFGLAGAAFSLAPWHRSAADAVKPHAPARSRLAQAGWASAWSSRAPPRHA